MLTYLRSEYAFLGLVLLWVLVSRMLGPVTYAFLPLTLLGLRSRDRYADLIMGFIIILVLSDVNKFVWRDNVFRNAKNIYMVLLFLFLLMERDKFVPLSNVFKLFLPFFLYSIFPLVFSDDFIIGVQKTLSYALLYFVVPNYVLKNFRDNGWGFMRGLVFFMTLVLLAGILMRYFSPENTIMVGRFHGIFGNPNGMSIYCYMMFFIAS